MSLLLHILVKVIFFTVLGVIVLTLLRWFTKSSGDQITPPSSGEWPEDKATYVDRISARRPYSSSRRDLQDEQERRRA
jgi:hypothetical protein